MRPRSALAAFACLTIAACQPRSATSDGSAAGATDSAVGPRATVPSVDSTARRDSGAASVELRTDKASYRRTDQMTMTLTNRTASRYVFNPCTRLLERQTASGWAAEREDRVCTLEGWILDPNGTRTAKTEFSETLPVGTYRAVIALTREDGAGDTRVSAVSMPFRLE
jgi:hypothetical protein